MCRTENGVPYCDCAPGKEHLCTPQGNSKLVAGPSSVCHHVATGQTDIRQVSSVLPDVSTNPFSLNNIHDNLSFSNRQANPTCLYVFESNPTCLYEFESSAKCRAGQGWLGSPHLNPESAFFCADDFWCEGSTENEYSFGQNGKKYTVLRENGVIVNASFALDASSACQVFFLSNCFLSCPF